VGGRAAQGPGQNLASVGWLAHAAFVDRIETGKRSSGQVRPGQVRFAFEVSNLQDSMAAASAAGVPLVSGPVQTPWKDLNARVAGPDGLQVTLFQTPP
jgi:methylmalonyl-CoA/ethylmalonyl-CoA epimerase